MKLSTQLQHILTATYYTGNSSEKQLSNLQVMAQWKVNFRRVCLAFALALALTTFWAVTSKVVTYSMHSEQVSSMLKESSKTASFCKLRQDTARASGLRN
jgi:hypothetical protein